MVRLRGLPGVLWHRVRDYWCRSLRRQLSVSFGLVALLMMTLSSSLLYLHQRDFLHDASRDAAMGMAEALAASSVPWVLAHDVAGLQEVLDSVAGATDLKFAMALSPRGQVLASTQPAQRGGYVRDPLSRSLLQGPAAPRVLVDDDDLLDLAHPVMAGERLVGWVRLVNTRASVNAILAKLAATALVFSLLAALPAMLVALWLGRRLTGDLYQLMQLAVAVEHGRRRVRSASPRRDEVAQLGHSLNRMLDALEESEDRLARLNRLYAAWTECTDIIVRETDESRLLHAICATLVRRVPFPLAWIGVPDATGRVVPAAASPADSAYLRRVRTVMDDSQAEGLGPTSMAIRTGRTQIYNDFLNDPALAPWRDEAAAADFRAAASFPLRRGARCHAAISVYSGERGFFIPECIALMHGLAEDISCALDHFDRERERQAVMAKLKLAASVYEHSAEGIMVTDAAANIIAVNRAFTGITGYPAEEVIGRNPRLLASGRHGQEFYRHMWQSLAEQGIWRGEIWNRRRSGEIYPEQLTISCVKDDAGAVTNYVAIFDDISERKQAEQRIRQLAQYDGLTGLPNRLLFADRLQHGLVQARRSGAHLAVLFLDLDRFKQINDTLGHNVGDELLQMVAQRLADCVREQDTVSRQGGDEFIAVLPATDAEGAALVADKMLQALVQPYPIQGHVLRISASIGIAIFPEHGQDTDTLVKHADVAMYQAKEAGRNRVMVFNPDMTASIYERLELETALRAALEERAFELFYQPQVELADGRIVACEVLIRWRHPEKGMVPPVSFIPLAEETGLIGPISDWVLEEALRQCRAWRTAGLPPLRISVNLSALQFCQRNLYEQVDGLLRRYGLPPEALELELTEAILMQGGSVPLATLHELTALGVGIAIDDFGTGHSSLSYLKRFPIRKLKIYQSFVGDVIGDSNDAAMVRTIILMAHSLNLRVVAEGVESEAQADFLRAAGCEMAQGYLYGKPLPAAEFAELLAAQAGRAGQASTLDPLAPREGGEAG